MGGNDMKTKLNILLFAFAVMVVAGFSTSCSDDDFTPTIFDTTEYPLDRSLYSFPLDTFVKKNFLEPYNLKFIYRLEDIGSDLQKNLVPASYEKSKELAVLSKYLWYDVYKKVAGEEFLKKYSPRIIHVIGSPAYNPTQGTETLGTAEGGLKITLYKTNELDVSNIDMMNEYFFITMHHEFAHILDQTYQRPSEFNTMSAGLYNVADWGNTHDSIAACQGFVTPYASSQAREDWVEVLANYVTMNDDEWGRLLATASYDWEQIDLEDISDYNKLIKPGCNLDTIGYVKEEQNGELKIVRKVVQRDVDGYVEVNDKGEWTYLEIDNIDGKAMILNKLDMVRVWLKQYWNIDVDVLRDEVLHRQYMTDANGEFVKDSKGRYVNRFITPTLEDPSKTLMDILMEELEAYKALMQ